MGHAQWSLVREVRTGRGPPSVVPGRFREDGGRSTTCLKEADLRETWLASQIMFHVEQSAGQSALRERVWSTPGQQRLLLRETRSGELARDR
jgi:hypothetical protein